MTDADRPDDRHPDYDPASLFCRIAAGEVPSFKLYEDEQVFAFLDVQPLSPGHALLIPKGWYRTMADVPDEVAAAMGRVLPRLCRALCQATGAADYNLLQNNGVLAHQAVEHVHVHVIPKPDAERGLGIVWPAEALGPELGRTVQAGVLGAMGTSD